MNGYGSQRRLTAMALAAIHSTTAIVCPTMYCGVPKKRAAASAPRPNASSPKAPRCRSPRRTPRSVRDDCAGKPAAPASAIDSAPPGRVARAGSGNGERERERDGGDQRGDDVERDRRPESRFAPAQETLAVAQNKPGEGECRDGDSAQGGELSCRPECQSDDGGGARR